MVLMILQSLLGIRVKSMDIPDVNYIKNENYETTNMNESLFLCTFENRDV